MLRKFHSKALCNSSDNLILKSRFRRHQKMHETHIAPSSFQTPRNRIIVMFLNLHLLSIRKESFHAAATVHCSPHNIRLFIINETINSILFQWLTLTSTYLYTQNPSVFTVSSKQSSTFYKTLCLNFIEKKYKIIVKKTLIFCQKIANACQKYHLLPKNSKIL